MSNNLWIIDQNDVVVDGNAKSFDDLDYERLIDRHGAPLIVVDKTDHFAFREFITSAKLGCGCGYTRYNTAQWVYGKRGGPYRCQGNGECKVYESEREQVDKWKAELADYAPEFKMKAWWPDRGITPPADWTEESVGKLYWPREEEYRASV